MRIKANPTFFVADFPLKMFFAPTGAQEEGMLCVRVCVRVGYFVK